MVSFQDLSKFLYSLSRGNKEPQNKHLELHESSEASPNSFLSSLLGGGEEKGGLWKGVRLLEEVSKEIIPYEPITSFLKWSLNKEREPITTPWQWNTELQA